MNDKQSSYVRAQDGERLSVIGTAVRFLCTGSNTGGGFSLLEVELPEGSGAPPHHHPWDECYYLLSGELEFLLDGQTRSVKGGDFLYAPGGTVHAFTGTSTKPARMLVFDAPAHSEGFFRDLDAEVRVLPDDLDKVPEIGRRHQLQFLQPE